MMNVTELIQRLQLLVGGILQDRNRLLINTSDVLYIKTKQEIREEKINEIIN